MPFDLETTYSRDGTRIAYYRTTCPTSTKDGGAEKPGLIILHGAMQYGLSHLDLATHLSDSFTCYLPDRRGRGQSGPTGKDYRVEREVEDLEAIHVATGAKFIFGVSSGALITLKAALAAPHSHIERIAVFEPPWWPENQREAQMQWVRRFEEQVDRGQLAAAAVTAMLGAQMGPALFQSKYFPRGVLVLLTRVLMRFDRPVGLPENGKQTTTTNGHGNGSSNGNPKGSPTQQQQQAQAPLFSDLVPTFKNDISIAMSMLGEKNLDSLAAIQTETLLLSGTKSPAYLQEAVRRLEKTLPKDSVRRVELLGIDHGGTFNEAQHGSPKVFADELRRFFARSLPVREEE